ncbi:MAG: hypothetical protein LBF88_03280 [Planctomycetaceae bacterium]|nr:hypothetical protein [Planctomycetaceae bacterium]
MEITVARKEPLSFAVRLVFEIYNGKAGIRYHTFIKNNENREWTITESDVIQLDFSQKPHTLHYIE